MKLKKVTVKNFRCFRHFDISFAEDVTVLIGKNGTGKSSLIHAVHNALSFIFANNPKWGVSPIIKGVPGLKIANINNMEIWRDKANMNTPADEVMISGEAEYNDISLSWNLNKTSVVGSQLKSVNYKQAYVNFLSEAEESKNYPVLAYYSDSFPHINTRMGTVAKEVIETFEAFPFNWGYYQWDEETSCTEIWQQRFINCWSKAYSLERSITNVAQQIDAEESEEGKARLRKTADVLTAELALNKAEVYFIERFIRKFTDNTSLNENDSSFNVLGLTMEIVNRTPYINLLFADGSSSFFSELPAGYQRLLSIVFDISYRAYILNGDKEPSGIVVIDELDLHLHPTLEQDVLSRLKNTFPQIQFIVSTHSPLIITNLKKDVRNKVIKLTYDGQDYSYSELPDLYGVDYSTGVRDGMNVNSTPAEIEVLNDLYFILLDKGEEKKAQEIFDEIARLTGGTQSLVIKKIEEERKRIQG